MRGGSTTYTFDGAQTIKVNQSCQKLVGLVLSQSMSAKKEDEGNGMSVKLTCPNWDGGNRIFPMGWIHGADTAANSAPQHADYDILPIDIDTPPNSSIQINIAGTLGATATGTYDVTVGLLYDDGNTPHDIIEKMPNHVAVQGGDYGYIAALATTTPTDFTTINIPAWANEVVGVKVRGVFDGAVTADQEFTGFVDIDFGITGQGVQKYPVNGAMPQDGTDVDGGQCVNVRYIPTHIDLSEVDSVQAIGKYTAYSALTGGADYDLGIIWR